MSLFKSLPQSNSDLMKRYQGELSDINLITSICGLKLAESKLNLNYLPLYIFEAKTERSGDISAIIIAIRLSVSEAEEPRLSLYQIYRGHASFPVQRHNNYLRFRSFIDRVSQCDSVCVIICEQANILYCIVNVAQYSRL